MANQLSLMPIGMYIEDTATPESVDEFMKKADEAVLRWLRNDPQE
jgi:hypothetical protein